jgi:hypothetical protein
MHRFSFIQRKQYYAFSDKFHLYSVYHQFTTGKDMMPEEQISKPVVNSGMGCSGVQGKHECQC